MSKNFSTYCEDRLEEVFTSSDDLMNAIAFREENTKRIAIDAQKTKVWYGVEEEDGVIKLTSVSDFSDGSVKNIKNPNKLTEAMFHTANVGTHLFLSVEKDKGPADFYPISAVARPSLFNRCGNINLPGEFDEDCFLYKGAPIVTILNRGLRGNTSRKRTLKLSIVHDKIIGVMSSHYSPAPQDELVKTTLELLREKDGCENVQIYGGTISNTLYSVDYNLNKTVEIRGIKTELFLTVLNSDNGCSSLRFVPRCRISTRGNRSRLYSFPETEYAARHTGLTIENYRSGVDTSFRKLEDIPNLIVNAKEYTLTYPVKYVENVINKLKYDYHKGGGKISNSLANRMLENIESAVSMGIYDENNPMTVMDVIDTFLQRVEDVETSPQHKEKLEATIMGILYLEHAKFDVAYKK
jgi:hypothetical protein